MSFGQALRPHIGVAVGNAFWAGSDLAFILHYGWAGLSFAPAGDSGGSHIGVAVGTYAVEVGAGRSTGVDAGTVHFGGLPRTTTGWIWRWLGLQRPLPSLSGLRGKGP